jgi:ketosteroid isomerase-like protein
VEAATAHAVAPGPLGGAAMSATISTAPDLSITTTEHPSAIRIREGFAAFSRGDLAAVRATMAPDCVWTNAGNGAIAGEYRGWDEIVAMLGSLIALTDGTFAMDLLSTLGDGRHAVAVYDATSTVKGIEATMRFAFIEQLDAQGLATSIQVMAYDQAAADAHISRAAG